MCDPTQVVQSTEYTLQGDIMAAVARGTTGWPRGPTNRQAEPVSLLSLLRQSETSCCVRSSGYFVYARVHVCLHVCFFSR